MSSIAEDLQPIRIILPGKFWDSQIYAGNLYLFGRDESLSVLGWNSVIDRLSIPMDLRVLAEDLLLGNDQLYEGTFRRYLQNDPEVQKLIRAKISRLRARPDRWILHPLYLGSHQDNPLPFPHNDSEIYYGDLYVGATSGVFKLDRVEKRSHRTKAVKISDAPALGIASKYSVMAIAAGDDGLLQTGIGPRAKEQGYMPVPKRCMSCEWSSANLICNDDTNSLYVAEFSTFLQDDKSASSGRRRNTVRQFEGIRTGEQLFGSGASSNETICWGAKGKLFAYRAGQMSIVRNRFSKSTSHIGDMDARFTRPEERPLAVEGIPAEFVSARAAPFGSVLEFDDRLIVLFSSGEQLTLEGEPVNWRVFPQSHKYVSHLHIVWEDRLEILVFVHDYFLPESERFYGTEAIDDHDRSGREGWQASYGQGRH